VVARGGVEPPTFRFSGTSTTAGPGRQDGDGVRARQHLRSRRRAGRKPRRPLRPERPQGPLPKPGGVPPFATRSAATSTRLPNPRQNRGWSNYPFR